MPRPAGSEFDGVQEVAQQRVELLRLLHHQEVSGTGKLQELEPREYLLVECGVGDVPGALTRPTRFRL